MSLNSRLPDRRNHRYPDRTMLWSSEGRDLAIYRRLSTNDIASVYRPFFDVRTMGLVSYLGLSVPFEKTMQDLLDYWRERILSGKAYLQR